MSDLSYEHLDTVIDRLVMMIGRDKMFELLYQIDERVQGIPKRNLRKVIDGLCITDKGEIDGG